MTQPDSVESNSQVSDSYEVNLKDEQQCVLPNGSDNTPDSQNDDNQKCKNENIENEHVENEKVKNENVENVKVKDEFVENENVENEKSLMSRKRPSVG